MANYKATSSLLLCSVLIGSVFGQMPFFNPMAIQDLGLYSPDNLGEI